MLHVVVCYLEERRKHLHSQQAHLPLTEYLDMVLVMLGEMINHVSIPQTLGV